MPGTGSPAAAPTPGFVLIYARCSPSLPPLKRLCVPVHSGVFNMALSQKDADVQMMLAAQCHLGTKNCDFQMERYVWKRRKADGIYILNLGKTWDKLQLAARIIVAIENPADIVVQSARPYGQRAVLKFAQYTGATCLSGRHTPGVPDSLMLQLQVWHSNWHSNTVHIAKPLFEDLAMHRTKPEMGICLVGAWRL